MQASPLSLVRLKHCCALGLLCLGWFLNAEGRDFQGSAHKLEYDAPPFNYSEREPRDPVALADKKLAAQHAAPPKYDDKFGYLPAVLEMMKVPAASQMFVFSKTSLQRHQIYPDNPRALYFSDTVYVGFIPGAPELEVAAVDPELGAVFYTVSQDRSVPLRFQRSVDCLSCHGDFRTMGIPGFMVRSTDTLPNGEPIAGTETEDISHCTPIEQRWGGWYVTGTPADWVTRGNQPGGEEEKGEAVVKSRVSAKRYPGKGSHAVTLLVHDHQTHMHDYFTRLSYETRHMMQMYGHIRYLHHQVNGLLRYLLFTEEAALPSEIAPDPAFTAAFQLGAHRDSKGRSLRDFDLHTRLFKYPCSFLIESEAFQQLPPIMREHLLKKLWEILTGQNSEADFASISTESRQAVLEILREILPNLPEYWKTDAPKTAASAEDPAPSPPPTQ